MRLTESYLAANERRHRALDTQIAKEASRPLPDTLRLQRLKRERLRAKQLCHVIRGRADFPSTQHVLAN